MSASDGGTSMRHDGTSASDSGMSARDGRPGLPPRPAANAETLASDADRDGAARVLNEAFAEGRLTADEHEDRVRAAYLARTWRELAGLTGDLPRPAGAGYGRAAPGMADGLDWCLICALLICCPPAGIALLLLRHRAQTGRSRASDAEDLSLPLLDSADLSVPLPDSADLSVPLPDSADLSVPLPDAGVLSRNPRDAGCPSGSLPDTGGLAAAGPGRDKCRAEDR
jgi:hypothetical protein